jgi:hypothetical protein
MVAEVSVRKLIVLIVLLLFKILMAPPCSTINSLESPVGWAISTGAVKPEAKGVMPMLCEKANDESSIVKKVKIVFMTMKFRF